MRFAILMIGTMFTSAAAFASGTTVGNGGNSIVCKDASGQITSVEILDLYEARINGFTLKLNPHLPNYKEILSENLSRWESIAPYRVAQYKKWLSEFESEALITSGDIPVIPDTGSVILPSGCELKPIAFQRRESELLPGVKRYTISKDLWDRMDQTQKAGLVMHELIYREGIQAGHTTSFPTRYFNGYLASADPKVESYAAVVSRLPLAWTELSGMVLNVFSRYGKSIVKEDGTVRGYIGEFFGDVETEKFGIVGGSFNYPDDSEVLKITYDGSDFSLGSVGVGSATWRAQAIKVSAKRYQFEFDLARFGFMLQFWTSIDDWGPWIGMDCVHDCGESFLIRLNEPSKNWLVTRKAQRISNIREMKFEYFLSGGNYATELRTSTGEVWKWDDKSHDYTQQVVR